MVTLRVAVADFAQEWQPHAGRIAYSCQEKPQPAFPIPATTDSQKPIIILTAVAFEISAQIQ